MQYERLTDKDMTLNLNINPQQDMTRHFIFVQRLWELENQIEKGELVNTKEYHICPEKLPSGKQRYLICKNGTLQDIYDFADTIEEAERKLKELQNILTKKS